MCSIYSTVTCHFITTLCCTNTSGVARLVSGSAHPSLSPHSLSFPFPSLFLFFPMFPLPIPFPEHGVRFRSAIWFRSDRRSGSDQIGDLVQIGDLNLTLTLSLTLHDLNLSIFPSIPCLVSARRSEPIIIHPLNPTRGLAEHWI